MNDEEIYIPSGDLGSGSGTVDSVNGQTGTVVLDQDDVGDGTTYKQYSATDKTKLAGIEAGADVTDATNVASVIHAATGKTTPVDADEIPLIDSAASNVLKKLTWANLKATIKSYYDTVSTTMTNKTLTSPVINSPTGIVKGDVGLGNVDNTSDVNKPVSTATQTALDAKVTGAASSTDNAVARFDLTSGKILQDSKLTVDDEGKIQYNTSGLTTSAAETSIISSSSTNNLGYANGVLRLIDNSMTINATSSQIVGRYFAVDTTGSVVKNDPSVTGWLPITYLFNSGGTYRADTNATSALAIRDMVGASNFDRINGGTLTVTEYSSFLSQGSVGAGVTITTLRGMWVTNLPTVSGTITNQIGIDIDAITNATTLAVGLRIGQPTTATTNRALQLTGTGTTVAGGIQFGGTSDTTNIYRSAASTLKTDGNLIVGTAGTAAGSAATIDGSQTLTNKTLTTPTIGSFANAGHNHTNAVGGGQLDPTTALTSTGTPSSSTFLRGDNTWSTPVVGGDVSSNTATSVDSEIALFNSTTGKSIKRATGTGVAHLTSGVLSASGVVNADLSTSAGELGAAWATYTPTWTNVSIGNATVGLRYKQIGKTVFVRGTVIYGNSTSVSGTIIFSLPVTSASYAGTAGTQPIGSGIIYDVSGGGVFRSAVIWNSTTTARLNVLPANGTWVSYFNADATNPVAPGTSDEWTVSFCYEAA